MKITEVEDLRYGHTVIAKKASQYIEGVKIKLNNNKKQKSQNIRQSYKSITSYKETISK